MTDTKLKRLRKEYAEAEKAAQFAASANSSFIHPRLVKEFLRAASLRKQAQERQPAPDPSSPAP